MRLPVMIGAALHLLLLSCHSSPDVRDVTRIDAVEIIRNIRCETREAVAVYRPDHWIHKAAIAYGFTFNAVEKNGLSGELMFTFPIPNGKWVLGLDGGVSKHREGENVVDIGELLGNLQTTDCLAPPAHAPAYPITGRVGVAEVIDRFVAVNSLPGLVQSKFTRALRYELKLNGGVSPSISVIPAKGHIRDAGFSATGNREDVHKLLITLVPPTKAVKAPAKGAKREGRDLILRTPGPTTTTPGSVERALRNLDVERRLRNDEQILQRLGP